MLAEHLCCAVFVDVLFASRWGAGALLGRREYWRVPLCRHTHRLPHVETAADLLGREWGARLSDMNTTVLMGVRLLSGLLQLCCHIFSGLLFQLDGFSHGCPAPSGLHCYRCGIDLGARGGWQGRYTDVMYVVTT